MSRSDDCRDSKRIYANRFPVAFPPLSAAKTAGVRPFTVTEAPSVARARAVASPIPAVEPVTSARFPFSPRSITGIDPGQPQTAPQSSCVGLDLEVFGDPTRPHMSTRTAGPHGPAVFGDRCSWADGNGCESGCAKCRPRREAPVSVNCRARPLRSDASCRGMAFAVALHVTTDQEAGGSSPPGRIRAPASPRGVAQPG